VIEGVEKTLQILELAQRARSITVALLSKQPGWNKASASRYLTAICEAGWLEKVSEKGAPRYVLGRKALDLAPDLRF